MNDFHQFRDKIRELVNIWKKTIKPGIEEQGTYGEENTKDNLIDPVLEALNWVDDGSKKIVDKEFAVKHKTGTGSADYALKVNGIPKILLEAKDVAKVKDLENGYDTVHGIKRTYPRQLSNYCHDLNTQGFDINFTILTNGKEWIAYNMQYADISSEREIVFRLDIEEMDSPDNLQKLWSLELNQFIDGHRLRELIQQLHDYRLDIDKKAVQQLLECKDLLSNSILHDYEKDKRGVKKQIDDVLKDKEKTNGMPTFQEIPEEERLSFFIKEASSNLINKILFIRILEDKNFLTPKLTKRSVEKWKDFMGYRDYEEIMKLFRDACGVTEKLYNGGLFKLNPYDQIEYEPSIIKKIIDILGEINFKEIDSDIIGRIYEIYLGQVLKVEAEIRGKKRTKYQADNQERKKLGQYYTPKFVVDFIVKNTLGKLIEGKKPEEIAKIRILDPACGSGSFLINAYDKLTEYYENWNSSILKKIEEDNKKNGASLDKYQNNGAVPNYKNIILKENIHGVDLNDLSVQIAEINLWLRALERDKKLIKLNKNILHGNSLITGVENEAELDKFKKELEEIKKKTHEIKDFYDKDELSSDEKRKLEKLEEELKELKNKVNPELNLNLKAYFDDHLDTVHPFNWEVEFAEVMENGGFDVVIGNPPYYTEARGYKEVFRAYQNTPFTKKYYEKNMDVFYYFIELSLDLLKENSKMGFIVMQYWYSRSHAKKLREKIMKDSLIKKIINFNEFKVFEDAPGQHNTIIILEKNTPGHVKDNYNVEIIDVTDKSVSIKEVKDALFNNLFSNKIRKRKVNVVYDEESKRIRFLDKSEEQIINKIEGKSNYKINSDHINKGLATMLGKTKDGQGVFVLSENELSLKNLNEEEKKLIKPFYEGNQIDSFFCNNQNEQWIIYSTKKYIDFEESDVSKIADEEGIEKEEGRKKIIRIIKKKYPNIINHLDSFKDVITSDKKPYGLHRPKTESMFETQDKLISLRKTDYPCFSLVSHPCYMDDTVYYIFNEDSKSLKYYLGILNSKMMWYWFRFGAQKTHGEQLQIDKEVIERAPLIKDAKIENKMLGAVDRLSYFKMIMHNINYLFNKSLSNQSIKDSKSCKFGHYFDNCELYGMERETSGRINEIKAKILSLDVKEEDDKIVIYMTNYNEEQDHIWEGIKAVKLTIKDEDVRKFLFFALKKYINDKGGRGFGSGNLLELIKNIEVPVYVQNVKMNIDKIKDVMKEFNHLTRDLWFKDESKKEKFNSLNELEDEIQKTDKEIDEMVYKLYGITEEEKKIIEESLR